MQGTSLNKRNIVFLVYNKITLVLSDTSLMFLLGFGGQTLGSRILQKKDRIGNTNTNIKKGKGCFKNRWVLKGFSKQLRDQVGSQGRVFDLRKKKERKPSNNKNPVGLRMTVSVCEGVGWKHKNRERHLSHRVRFSFLYASLVVKTCEFFFFFEKPTCELRRPLGLAFMPFRSISRSILVLNGSTCLSSKPLSSTFSLWN